MVDEEVEQTLREIRERVRAEAAALELARAGPPAAPRGGGDEPGGSRGRDSFAADALSRMEANLSTTGRAWSGLPPVTSYRRGAAARLELWLKRQIKRATHWFTWEQVNFNSGAHHALRDALAALAAHERALADLKRDLFAVRDELRGAVGQVAADAAGLREHFASTERRLEEQVGGLRDALGAGLDELRGAVEAARRPPAEHARLAARVGDLENELRERAALLAEEQRVCFRQLSLEAGETAHSFDRARRLLEERLGRLEEKKP